MNPPSANSVKPPVSAGSVTGGVPAEPSDAPTVISNRHAKVSLDQRIIERIPSRQLGAYQIIEAVGAGGMAAVLRALDTDLNRTVALKILPPEMAEDPEHLERFRQEARAAARLDCENVARVYSIGEDQGLNFIAFEFVEGENLRQRMERQGGRLAIADAVPLMVQVAAGLSHAASRGVVHRDVKPSNILITPENKAKIVDMGLARSFDGRNADGGITQSGITLGTFDYISPEQAIDPRKADPRSDIYSLGCTFYHALTGRSPVPEGTAAQKLQFHQNTPPVDPRKFNPLLSDELTAILGRMMAKDPANRYQRADDLIQHLLALIRKESIPLSATNVEALPRNADFREPIVPEPPRFPVGAAASAALALAGLLIWLLGGFGGRAEPPDKGPFWLTAQPKKWNPPAEVQEGDPRAARPAPDAGGIAETAGDLKRLLREGQSPIKLRAGTVYDLTRDAGEEAAPIVFPGTAFKLDGGEGLQPPTLVLETAAGDDAEKQPNALYFTDALESAEIAGVRFAWKPPADGADGVNRAGLLFPKIDRFRAVNCGFGGREGSPLKSAAYIEFQGAKPRPAGEDGEFRFSRCYFAPGVSGVRIDDRALLAFDETAFAPFQNLFRIDSARRVTIQLDRCTAMVRGGAILEAGDGRPALLAAEGSVFAAVDDLPENAGVLIRQTGEASPDTAFRESLKIGGDAARANQFYHVAPLSVNDAVEPWPKDRAPAGNPRSGSGILAKPPWQELRPLQRLANPLEAPRAFALKPKSAPLWDLADYAGPGSPPPARMLGTRYLMGSELYDLPLRFVDPLAPATRIVEKQPSPEAVAAGIYPSIKQAIAEANPGDEIVLRWNGARAVSVNELGRSDEAERPEVNLTIRADAACKPVLTLKLDKTERVLAFFRLSAGQLRLENLHFRVDGEKLPPDAARAVVSMPAGGRCSFKNCLITLADQDRLSAVQLGDGRDEMMMADGLPAVPPKVSFENCFVRGRGRLLSVRTSRPFELEVRDTLAALDGPLVDVRSSPLEFAADSAATVHFHRATTYLTGPVFDLEAGPHKLDARGTGLVPTQATAVQSLFAPAAGPVPPLVKFDRAEGDMALRDSFKWTGSRDNHYAFDTATHLIERAPENPETMPPPAPATTVDADRWLELFREAGRPFGPVKFLGLLPEVGKSFGAVKPADFRHRGDPAGDAGAPLDTLPVPYEGEP